MALKSNLRFIYLALSLGVTVTTICLSRDSEGISSFLNLSGLFVYSPYFGILYLTKTKKLDLIQSQIWLLGVTIIIGYAVYNLIYNQLHRDAQGPLIYL